MMSDNANTFIPSSKQHQDLFKSIVVREEPNNRGIMMIPKRAPLFCGTWERLIGLTKATIKKVPGRSCVTYETLQTVITEIEAMINNRLLTYVPSDTSDELEVLTPSHVLYSRRITKLPYEDVPTYPITSDRLLIIKRVTIQTTLINHFTDNIRRGRLCWSTAMFPVYYGNLPWLKNSFKEKMALLEVLKFEIKMD